MTDATGNVQASWEFFNPDGYIGHNYRDEVLPEDKFIIEHMISRIAELCDPRTARRILNVGHGANFYPDMVMQQLLWDDGVLELMEIGWLNLAEMCRVIAAGLAGDKGIWKKFEDAMRATSPDCGEPLMRAWRHSKIVQESVYKLPADTYDHGAMFFCAESITGDRKEYERSVDAFLNSVKPGGFVAMAFMRGSEGYATAGRLYPAVPIECPDVEGQFSPKVRCLEVVDVPAPRGARPEDGPQYTGMGIATGLRI